jgi:hypothetical protein
LDKKKLHGSAVRSVSLNALIAGLVMLVPIGMLVLALNGDNPFVDNTTIFVVFLISIFLLIVIWINQHIHIPLLDVFILVYVVFWHLRFFTLPLFPSSELVLTRTVVIDHEIFNIHAWFVFASLMATVIGILAAYKICRHKLRFSQQAEAVNKLNTKVKQNIHSIFFYCLSTLAYFIYTTQILEDVIPAWVGYLGLFFPFSLTLLLVVLVLLNIEISKNYRIIFLIYMLIYVGLSVLTGSRSILLYFVLSGLFLLVILGEKITIRLRHFILILFVISVMVVGFTYGTYQRHMRNIYGFSANAESTQYVFESMANMDDWEPILGMAAARAGMLDYSAEMFANPQYSEVVSLENELKSTIDNYVPGSIFEESSLIEQRLKDVYNPNAEGYQSDALGVVGETYLLFSYAFPLIMALVAFGFTYFFYAARGDIFGVYIRFSIAVAMMTWWNSFGYDWLLVNSGRQLICGLIIIALIFRDRRFSMMYRLR